MNELIDLELKAEYILYLEKTIKFCQNEFDKMSSKFLEMFYEKTDVVLESFRKRFNLDESFRLDFFLHGLNYHNFQNWKKEITYKIVWGDTTYLYNENIGWFWSGEINYTKFNVNLAKFSFTDEDLELLISEISNSFNSNLTLKPQIENIEDKFFQLLEFNDVQLFLNEKVEWLYEDKIFYRYDDDDIGNFYFIKNSKGEILVFVSETSNFALENLEDFKILKRDIKKLDIFFSRIWHKGDNFEFEELGKQWKQKILDSWKNN